MIPEYDPSDHREYCPTVAELAAELDALEAKLDCAEARIDAALAPEPVDWERYYRDLFADVAAAAERWKGGEL